MQDQKIRNIVGGREHGLTRDLSTAGKMFENLILFLRQKTRDEIIISGTGWVFLSKQLWGASNQGVKCVKSEYQGLGG